MKKVLFIFIFIFSLFLKANVYAAGNPYKKTFNYNGHPLTNCTWYAWDQASRKAQVNLPGWGNAATWYNSAKNAGFEVGSHLEQNQLLFGHGIIQMEKISAMLVMLKKLLVIEFMSGILIHHATMKIIHPLKNVWIRLY